MSAICFSSYLDITGCRCACITIRLSSYELLHIRRILFTPTCFLQSLSDCKNRHRSARQSNNRNLSQDIFPILPRSAGDIPSYTRISNEVDVTIFPSGFLEVGKSDGVDSVIQGQSIFYTIDITNIGSLPILADTITCYGYFLSNVNYLTIDPNGLDIEPVYNTGNVRSWDIRNIWLMPGEKISFYIGVRVSSSPVSDTASNLVAATAKDKNAQQLPIVSAIDEDEILVIGRRIYFPFIRVYSNNPTPTPTLTLGPSPYPVLETMLPTQKPPPSSTPLPPAPTATPGPG